MNRGQDRNITDGEQVREISLSIPIAAFLNIISEWYDALLADEKDDPCYEKGEYWSSDLLCSKNYPSLSDLWNESEDIVAKLVLDSETDLMDLVYMDKDGWMEHNYYIHEIDRFHSESDVIIFSGSCIYSPNQNEHFLANLIDNISNPEHHENILLESLKELRNGKRNAVAAMPKVANLVGHNNIEVSEAAKQTLEELEKHA
ncbi:hypothetical protein [Zooshikella harenae]|uniref:Immunity protein 30 domain-containing protein n=1 Tax=Zooshikella harenae TaxID=2827238 RepID=A0ABS5ZJ73_9GAMM|nr:hypothetical protein [Zooshikella harenae]MBU2714077.1 hypothetical protein [Zooshikella harenae]